MQGWRMLRPQRQRIGLQRQHVAVHTPDLVFVERAGGETGKEELPHADAEVTTHRMPAAVPIVERAYDADAARIRRPDGEHDAGNVVDGCFVRAQTAIELEMTAFGDEMEVHRSQQRREAVWVLDLGVVDAKAIREGFGVLQVREEEARGIDTLERGDRLALRVDKGDVACLRKEGADDEAVGHLVHAEIRERVVVVAVDDRLDRPLFIPRRHARRLSHGPILPRKRLQIKERPRRRSAYLSSPPRS